MKTGLNLNFNDPNRTAKYPKIEDVIYGIDSVIVELIETLPPPTTTEELKIFNEVWNQFHCRGGKA